MELQRDLVEHRAGFLLHLLPLRRILPHELSDGLCGIALESRSRPLPVDRIRPLRPTDQIAAAVDQEYQKDETSQRTLNTHLESPLSPESSGRAEGLIIESLLRMAVMVFRLQHPRGDAEEAAADEEAVIAAKPKHDEQQTQREKSPVGQFHDLRDAQVDFDFSGS